MNFITAVFILFNVQISQPCKSAGILSTKIVQICKNFLVSEVMSLPYLYEILHLKYVNVFTRSNIV